MVDPRNSIPGIPPIQFNSFLVTRNVVYVSSAHDVSSAHLPIQPKVTAQGPKVA